MITYTAGSTTAPAALSGALANRLREGKSAEVKCIGAVAVTRAATACALASSYAELAVGLFPEFRNEPSDDGESTVSVLVLRIRRLEA